MNIGMLWFDNTPDKPLNEKIKGAADYYTRKYGKTPTLCFVHPAMVKNTEPTCVPIKTNRAVLPNHLWIGME